METNDSIVEVRDPMAGIVIKSIAGIISVLKNRNGTINIRP